ncbi:MAG: hypothetical protein KatS3mg032_0912 [Cyclobacteriaceae bacterium]|nr:MAG: hypothetical protein KatS3mg032_0912 [Cyclobacteriaceae bacterium]
MRLPGVILAAGLLSCNSSDPLPLIRQYEVIWETSLADRYNHYELPQRTHVFGFISVNPDGTIYVIHHPDGLYDQSYITLLNADGSYMADSVLPDEYIFQVLRNAEGNMVSVSALESGSYVLKTWNENFSSAVLKTIPPATYFRQLYFRNNVYYEISYNLTINDYELMQYDFNDQVRWKNRLSTYQAEGHTLLMFFPDNNDILLANNKNDYQNLVINRINSNSGAPVWRKDMVLHKFGLTSPMPLISPLSGGNLILFDKFNYVQIDARGVIQSYSRLGSAGSIPENYIRDCISESDGGYLLLTSFVESEGWYGLRLIKTDSRLNAGWVGNFRQTSLGYLSAYARKDNVLILLTTNGYLYAIRPAN